VVSLTFSLRRAQIVFLTDPTGQLLWISDGWYQYTGMDEHYRPSVEEWVGASALCAFFLPPTLRFLTRFVCALQTSSTRTTSITRLGSTSAR